MGRLTKLATTLIILTGLGMQTIASDLCPTEVRYAIGKYKAQDYVGCIQDLEEYTQEDPSNAVAYYYTGIAYMKVGMKEKAIESFNKVSTINSVPVLSSYAIQATTCMNSNLSHCVYKKYSKAEITEMVADPAAFFAKKAAEPEDTAPEVSVEDTEDIDKLIKGQFPENIHPDANKVIQETRLMQEQERVNAELNKRNKPVKKKPEANADKKSEASVTDNKLALSTNPSDKEIADAVRTLNKAGYKFVSPDEQNSSKKTQETDKSNFYKQMAAQYALQDDAAQMALMFGGNSNRNRNSFDTMLPYLLMQEQQKNPDGTTSQNKINPELIKTMMMSQMMGDFDMGFDKDKDR